MTTNSKAFRKGRMAATTWYALRALAVADVDSLGSGAYDALHGRVLGIHKPHQVEAVMLRLERMGLAERASGPRRIGTVTLGGRAHGAIVVQGEVHDWKITERGRERHALGIEVK